MSAPKIPREERYVRVPLRLRREHRTWPAEEHAAWVDLYLAAYEVHGRFESMELLTAMVGPRAQSVSRLIERGELVAVGEEWIFPYYFDCYTESGQAQRRPREQRLEDAEQKLTRNERLTDAEYAARARARREGFAIPDARRGHVEPDDSDDQSDTPDVRHTTTTTKDDEDHHTNGRASGSLVVAVGQDASAALLAEYEQLYGKAPTPQKAMYLRSLCSTYTAHRAHAALVAEHSKDPNPRTICGRMEAGLRVGNSRGYGSGRT